MTDLVANLRVDQAWGGAQVMGALHEVNASYYSAANALQSAPSTTGAGGVGHPGDKWGWAAGVGLKINTPFITQGDWFQTQVNVTQGALRYLFNTPNTNWGKVERRLRKASACSATACTRASVAFGNNTGCHADLRLGRQRRLRALLDPGLAHLAVRRLLPSVVWQGYRLGQRHPVLGGGLRQRRWRGTLAVADAGCNNNWSTWGVGSRTQWDVTKTFYLGVEVLYSELNSAIDRNRLWLSVRPASPATPSAARLSNEATHVQLDGQRSRSPRLPALIA